jgi:hypothetical protein
VADTSGATAALAVKAVRNLRGAEAALLAANAERDGPILVAARYLAKPIRDRLQAGGVGFADATGNLFVRLERPALFIWDRGADSDPWRGAGRPALNLGGPVAAAVVRALVDVAGPWTARELAEAAGVGVGSVYRVMGFLEAEGLANRDLDRRFAVTDWAGVLRAWSRDYGFVASNRTSRWIAPHGLEHFLAQSRTASYRDYALTGSLAAHHWAEATPARLAMVYVRDAHEAACAWGLTAS